jgi:hypothetical protein
VSLSKSSLSTCFNVSCICKISPHFSVSKGQHPVRLVSGKPTTEGALRFDVNGFLTHLAFITSFVFLDSPF